MNNKSNFYIVVYFLTLALSNNASFAVSIDGEAYPINTIIEETDEDLQAADDEVDVVEADADDLVVGSIEKRYYDFAMSLGRLSEAQAESFIDFLRHPSGVISTNPLVMRKSSGVESWDDYQLNSVINPQGQVNFPLLARMERDYKVWLSKYGSSDDNTLNKSISKYSQFGGSLYVPSSQFPSNTPGVFLNKDSALDKLDTFKPQVVQSELKPEEVGRNIVRMRPMYGLPHGFYEHYVNSQLISVNEADQAHFGRPSRNVERYLSAWNDGYIYTSPSNRVQRTLEPSKRMEGQALPSHLRNKKKTSPSDDANENHYWRLAATSSGQIKEDVMLTVKWARDKYPSDDKVKDMSNKLSISEIRSLVSSSGMNSQDKTRVLDILPTDEKMRTLKGNGFNVNDPLAYITVPPRGGVIRRWPPILPDGGGVPLVGGSGSVAPSGGSAPYKRLVGPLPPKILLPDDSTRTKSKLRPKAKKKK